MKREVIRVEPLSTYLERWKAPTSAVTRHGDTIYVSGFPPFDPATGEVIDAPIERQTELVLDQLKLCVETAGSSLEKVATKQGFARIFHGDPTIGGRYSVLSPFGLVPAATAGIDVRTLIQHTLAMVRSCGPDVPPSFSQRRRRCTQPRRSAQRHCLRIIWW